jgi:hypothetical protein
MDDLFPIRAAAKITGLSIDILRAWERRYGRCSRTHFAGTPIYANRSRPVVIGATGDSDTIRQQLRHLHNELPARVELWLGGAAAADFSAEVGGPQSFILKDFNEFEDRCRWFRGKN